MADALTFAPALQARLDAFAARSGLTPAEIVTEALVHGRSLDWQERFVERIEAGLADADAGRFATSADFERLRRKYRSP